MEEFFFHDLIAKVVIQITFFKQDRHNTSVVEGSRAQHLLGVYPYKRRAALIAPVPAERYPPPFFFFYCLMNGWQPWTPFFPLPGVKNRFFICVKKITSVLIT